MEEKTTTTLTGTMTAPDQISDTEVVQLEKQGYKEGDFVPGRGVLTPEGTFKGPAVVTSSNAATQTKQNISDLTTATTPNQQLTPAEVDEYYRTQTNLANPLSPLEWMRQKRAGTLSSTTTTTTQTPITKSPVDEAILKATGTETVTTPTGPTRSQAEIDAENALRASQDELTKLQAGMDSRSAQLMDYIKQEYDGLIKQQEVANRAYEGGVTTEGLRSGRARYAPVMQGALIKQAVDQGIGEIQKLQLKKNQLLLQAQQARDEQAFKTLNETMSAYRDVIKEERALAQKTYENAIKASQEARDIAKFEQDMQKQGLEQLNQAGFAVVGGEVIPTLANLKEQRIGETENINIQVDTGGRVSGIDKRTGKIVWQTGGGVGRSGSASPNLLVSTIADPVTGSPSAVQVINKDTGNVEYKDPTTGATIDPADVVIGKPQDPLETMINDIINETLQP